MAEITAAAVKALRELTDLPMMDCKRALMEAGGDQDKAIEILKQAFKKIQLKRQDNPTEEGRIFMQIKEDGSEAALVELQCESAPVAGSEDFTQLGDQLAKQLLEGPGAETADDLLGQTAPDLEGTSLKEMYEQVANKIREKITVARICRVNGPVGGYVHHDGKTAVLFQAEGDDANNEILRDVSMHIAALKPVAVNPEDLPADVVQAERDRLSEEAKLIGKPDNIIEKIVDGRMNNFYVEKGVLTLQQFAKDDSKTVSQVLAEHSFKAGNFTCWVLGT
jgi:elongation factor Ts